MKNFFIHPVTVTIARSIALLLTIYFFNFFTIVTFLVFISAYDKILDHYEKEKQK